MGKGKNNTGSLAATIATAVIAAAAIAAVVIMLVVVNGNKPREEAGSSTSEPQVSQELVNECSTAAFELVQNNYTVLKLFVLEGLPYKTVYGNRSEDGYYTVDDSEYKSYSQIEELVKSVYVEREASRVLLAYPIKTESGTENVQVYKQHKDPVDGSECLGIIEEFAPDKSYSRDWSKCVIKVSPKSEDLCVLSVITGGYSESEAEAHPEAVMTTNMVKKDGRWLLSEMLL
ncbi:MAG: hypothetical protein ACI4JY_01835 [Oscillospiraceae bacterium]